MTSAAGANPPPRVPDPVRGGLRRWLREAKPMARLLVRPLWHWIVRYAFLAAMTAILMGIVANWFLWQLGLPYLFWHESWGRRLFAGIGVGMFTINVAVVGFLLTSRAAWVTELEAVWPSWEFRDSVLSLLVRYLLLTSGVLVAAVWLFTLRAPHYLSGPARLLFPAAVTLGAVLAAGGLWLTRSFTESQVRRGTWLGRLLASMDGSEAPPSTIGAFVRRRRSGQGSLIPTADIHRAAAVFFVSQLLFFIVVGLLAVTPARHVLSAGLVLAMFMSAMVSGYGALRWWGEENRVWLFAGIVGFWVVLAAWGPYRHTLYDIRHEYERAVPVTVRPLPNPNLLDSAATMEAWGRNGGRRPLVVLAVDGGGIRAATWIVSMLTTLEQDIPGFPSYVRVITGASGGMVGAAYYVATLQKPGAGAVHVADKPGRTLSRDQMIDAISADALEATTRRLVFRDVWPVVWRAYADRGHALERAWEENTGSMDQPLSQLAAGEAEGWRPSLIFSPMIVEDGRRLLVSNLDLAPLTTAHLPTGARSPIPASQSALEFAKLVPRALDLHVSTVARMSASFPYVSPAAEVPTRPLRRVVDAGYYDEHGVALATAWILANETAIRQHASKVVLIQMPDQRTDPNRLPDPCAPAWWSRGLSDLVSPPHGVLSGWTGGMNFRNDEAVQTLGRILNPEGADFFRSYVFEPYDPVPPPDGLYVPSDRWDDLAKEYCEAVDELRPVSLSWHMISTHRRQLSDVSPHTVPNCEARRSLAQWMGGAPSTPQGCRDPVPEPPPLVAPQN